MTITTIEEPKQIKIEREGTKTPSPTEFPDNERIKESMDFAENHKTILERVRAILRCDKLARKDYLWLMLIYYCKCNMIKILVPLENFSRHTSPSSISRCRRELFRKAKKGDKELAWLLLDKEFIEETEKMEELFRDYYSNQKYQERVRLVK